VLIEQTYPGLDDYRNHFYAVLAAFKDSRYIKVDGKPMFLLYKPELLPDSRQFTDCWQALALKEGLPGIHFVGVARAGWNPIKDGFDASVLNEPRPMIDRLPDRLADRLCKLFFKRQFCQLYRRIFGMPRIIPYERIIKEAKHPKFDFLNYPCVVPNWDTTPRMGDHAIVFHNATPALFRIRFQEALDLISGRSSDHKIIFLKSWNEWAEGNYVEPSRRFGRGFLEVIRDCLAAASSRHAEAKVDRTYPNVDARR
jgi:hypothetical protein